MTSVQMELGLGLGLPQDAGNVNGRIWFRDLDGNRAVFVNQVPFYCYPLDDPVLHRFCAIQLVEAGLVKVREICLAFDIHDRAFSRYRARFREHFRIWRWRGTSPTSNPCSRRDASWRCVVLGVLTGGFGG